MNYKKSNVKKKGNLEKGKKTDAHTHTQISYHYSLLPCRRFFEDTCITRCHCRGSAYKYGGDGIRGKELGLADGDVATCGRNAKSRNQKRR